jgi:hypothetical protein
MTAKQKLMAEGKKSEQLIAALQKAAKKEVRL